MSNWLSHASILGHIGKYGQKISDPLAWIGGDKWTHLTSDVLPEKVNQGLSAVMRPFDKIDQTINPVRKIPIVNRVSNIVAAKPGDALAIAAGAVFGGAAALGGGGAGAAGGGAAGAGEGTAMGGAAGTLGAADSAAASSGLGLTAADVGGGAAAGGAGGADVAGLAAQDSAAVDAEGAAPGLTEGYGPAQSASATSTNYSPQQQQQEEKRRPIEQLAIMHQPTLAEREAALMVDSSRALKTSPGFASMRDLAQVGATGQDRITENGVHIGAIRALHTKISRLEAVAKQRGIAV